MLELLVILALSYKIVEDLAIFALCILEHL